MTPAAAVPLVVLVALLVTCLWVYRDAEANVRAGAPVLLRVGGLRIDTPQAWAAGCLVLFFVFLPLYLAARNRSFDGS